MIYLLSRARPEMPAASPEGFAEARFIKELESTGFLNRWIGNTESEAVITRPSAIRSLRSDPWPAPPPRAELML